MGEDKLIERTRRATQHNPYVAELMAFRPAFDSSFPDGCELPPREERKEPREAKLLEALDYCIGFDQVGVWLDTDDDVRRFLRCCIFEDEETDDSSPPMAPLPDLLADTSPLVARWKKARQDAMELWASEMSV